MLVPLSLRWSLVTPVPHGRLGEERKIPSAIFIFLDYSLLEKPRLLSTTLSHCPLLPCSSQCCCFAACPSDCGALSFRPCLALQAGWAFPECNAGHFWLSLFSLELLELQGISMNGLVSQLLLSLLEHKGLSNTQTLISDTDSEGGPQGVGVLA